MLVEIETYPDSDADRQVLDDLMLIAVGRNIVPEVVSLVLKPKGNLTVTGAAERKSRRGKTKLGGSWPVVRLWELEAETLLNSQDAGLIPWVPLTHTNLSPDELMMRCRDRLAQVPEQKERAGLEAVTIILAGLAFPDKRFLDLFGGEKVMIESPFYNEWKEKARKDVEKEITTKTRVTTLIEALETRFGTLPKERVAPLQAITDESRLKELHRLVITCPNLDTFVAALASNQ